MPEWIAITANTPWRNQLVWARLQAGDERIVRFTGWCDEVHMQGRWIDLFTALPVSQPPTHWRPI